MKKILFTVFVIVGLSACLTDKKLSRHTEIYLSEHPDVLAEKCAKAFPIKDSTGAIETEYKPAQNVDYSRTIDSLTRLADSLGKLGEDYEDQFKRQGNNDSLQACEAILIKYRDNIKSLQQSIATLKSNYKPCIPDTVKKTNTVYRENTALVSSQGTKISNLTLEITKYKARGIIFISLSILFFLISLAEGYLLYKSKTNGNKKS